MKKTKLISQTVERVILFLPRYRLRRKVDEKLRALNEALVQCIGTQKKLAHFEVPDVRRLFEASQFCLMYDADLTVLLRDMTCSHEWWESRLYGRLLAMTMLECVEDIPEVLGRDFRVSLAKVITDPTYQNRISAFTKGLSGFRKRHEKELRNVRTIVAAHRDHNVFLQASVIEDLDIKRLMGMARDLNDLIGDFARTMTGVLQTMNIVQKILGSLSNDSEENSKRFRACIAPDRVT